MPALKNCPVNSGMIYVLFRWFTYYEDALTLEERLANRNDTCQLVGFNLKQACFNLENTCVLLKECNAFNTTCKTCKVRLYRRGQ